MKKILVFLFFCAFFVLCGQNNVSIQRQKINDDGVLINTAEGVKTFPIFPGYIYIQNQYEAQLLNGLCGIDHRISEIPKHEGGGNYRFLFKPSGFHIAVYKNGLRLTPEKHYKIWWEDPTKMPTGITILDNTNTVDVVVDYQVGLKEPHTP